MDYVARERRSLDQLLMGGDGRLEHVPAPAVGIAAPLASHRPARVLRNSRRSHRNAVCGLGPSGTACTWQPRRRADISAGSRADMKAGTGNVSLCTPATAGVPGMNTCIAG
jgi:hypothetical protein